MKTYLKRALVSWIKFNDWYIKRGAVLLVALVGGIYNIKLFQNVTQDTTSITNVAFGIVASLSALSFACSRTIEGPPEHKSLFPFAGERFLHSAILLIIASILKYASLTLLKSKLADYPWFITGLSFVFGIFVGFLFLRAWISACHGLDRISGLLVDRDKVWD